MAVFPISYLRDDFENNVVDPAWATAITGSATRAETGGQAVFTLPSSTAGSHVAQYVSSATYDLTGDQAVFAVGTMVATGVAATAYMRLVLDGNNYYQWTQTSGTLKAQKIVAGATTDLFSVAWSATTHKYLRIRESGGTVFFDSSTSASAGAAWTARGNTTIATAFAVTDLRVVFGAQCGNIASPGSLRLDMFNLVLPTPTRTWRWTDADWGITNRIRPITLASSGNKQGVIVTAAGKDSSNTLTGTLRYFAGPLGSASGGYAALTEYASLVLAQANPFDIPLDGRVDLPALIDCRIVRLYHSSDDGASGTLREFVPRRIVQADDIEAESIRAINIAASTITADKIAVLDLDATHYITAGGGMVKLDDQGIVIRGATSYLANRAYGFTDGTNRTADLFAIEAAATHYLQAYAYQVAGKDTQLLLNADAPTGKVSVMRLATFVNAAKTAEIQLGSGTVSVTTGDLNVNTGGVNVGITGSGAGQISTSDSVGFGTAAVSNVRVIIKAQDNTSSNYAVYVNDSTNTLIFFIRNDGLLNMKGPIQINAAQVVTSRRTGWAAATGTATRTTFATGSVTLAALAEHVKALIDDLITHGLIGA